MAIVTGAESGIGRASALALAREGYDVGVTWHRDEAAGKHVAAMVEAEGRRAALRYLELAAGGQPAQVVEELAGELSGLDALVNSAGIGHIAGALKTTEEDLRRVIDVDLVGAFLVAQAAARHMIAAETEGRIVLISSVHERIPLANCAAYTAAKHGVGGFAKTMALELAPHGITVNCVAPGGIATALTVEAQAGDVPDERVPAGRLGRVEEVARTVVHLCAPEAAYVTGSSYVVDGGLMHASPPAAGRRPRRAGGRLRRLLR